jgi:hypothetical protein
VDDFLHCLTRGMAAKLLGVESDRQLVERVLATPPTTSKTRFAPGNPGGPGNPFARQVAELRKVMLAAVTLEQMRVVTEAMIERAAKGDVAAAKLLLQYTLGKPAAAVEPDRVEIEDYKLRTESAVPAHVWGPMREHLQARNVNEIAVATEPLMQATILEPVEQVLRGEVPTKLSRTARKAMNRETRRLRREHAPSPNGSNGAPAKRPLEGSRRAPKTSTESGRAS